MEQVPWSHDVAPVAFMSICQATYQRQTHKHTQKPAHKTTNLLSTRDPICLSTSCLSRFTANISTNNFFLSTSQHATLWCWKRSFAGVLEWASQEKTHVGTHGRDFENQLVCTPLLRTLTVYDVASRSLPSCSCTVAFLDPNSHVLRPCDKECCDESEVKLCTSHLLPCARW